MSGFRGDFRVILEGLEGTIMSSLVCAVGVLKVT